MRLMKHCQVEAYYIEKDDYGTYVAQMNGSIFFSQLNVILYHYQHRNKKIIWEPRNGKQTDEYYSLGEFENKDDLFEKFVEYMI